MADIHTLTTDSISDDALMHRLFELTCQEHGDRRELDRIEALVYARLTTAYDAVEPPHLPGRGQMAA